MLPTLTFRISQEAATKRSNRNVNSLFFRAAPGMDLHCPSKSVLRPWLASQSEVVQVMDRMDVSKTHSLIPAPTNPPHTHTPGQEPSATWGFIPLSPFFSLPPWILFTPTLPHTQLK